MDIATGLVLLCVLGLIWTVLLFAGLVWCLAPSGRSTRWMCDDGNSVAKEVLYLCVFVCTIWFAAKIVMPILTYRLF